MIYVDGEGGDYMAMEKEAYRDNIELIKEMCPGKLQFDKTEAARMLKIDPRTLEKHVKINVFGKVSVADLARGISG